MLIYSEERYISTEVNMMIIRAKDNIGYYYVHRGLYDQAVVLSDLYADKPFELCKLITGNDESRRDVEEFLMELPKPINILGCFLLLVDGEVTEKLDRVGAIHVMSGPLNFRKLITIPMEARAEITFSLSIAEEYQLPWDKFFKEAIPFDANYYRAPAPLPMNGTATMVYNDTSELVSPSEGVEMDPDEMLLAALMDDSDDLFDFDTDEEEVESSGEVPEPVTPVQTVVETVSPVETVSAPKSGLDIVRRLGR